jgi:hypothetical protein
MAPPLLDDPSSTEPDVDASSTSGAVVVPGGGSVVVAPPVSLPPSLELLLLLPASEVVTGTSRISPQPGVAIETTTAIIQ